jgi:hypothetical protein
MASQFVWFSFDDLFKPRIVEFLVLLLITFVDVLGISHFGISLSISISPAFLPVSTVLRNFASHRSHQSPHLIFHCTLPADIESHCRDIAGQLIRFLPAPTLTARIIELAKLSKCAGISEFPT